MNIFKLFNWFKKNKPELEEETYNSNDYIDPETGETTKSSIEYNRADERFLKLDDKSCAMIIHPGSKVEVVFTRLYDKTNQRVTLEEETLMAIAIFMRQPGFAEMLRHEFHQIAMNNISTLTENGELNE
jgi:hypothetical protein